MIPSYLLDTNALSEPSRKQPNRGFMDWFMAVEEHSLYTSCIVLGEVRKGVMLLPVGDKQRKFEKVLTEIIESFDGRVVEVDLQTALIWGELLATGQQAGRTPPVIDALIAAQCITHNLMLVTRNIKDFEQFSKLKVFSPWS